MLEHYLITQLFAFLLIFCRMGAGIMVLPGIGEAYVSARLRLMLALMIALCLTPVFTAQLPKLPASPIGIALLILSEVLVGLFIGGLCRMMISAMHIAGTIAASQSSLSSATLFDITQASQGTTLSNLLSYSSLVLLFSLNMHHIMLRGLSESYSLFPPGEFPPVGDFVDYASHLMTETFAVAVQISAPITVVSLLLYFAAGILSRLMPTMQVFFIISPLQILISFFLLMVTMSALMLTFASFFETKLIGFLSP